MVAHSDIRLRNLSLFVVVSYLVYFIYPFPFIVWRLALVFICLYVIFLKPHRFSALEKWMLVLSTLNLVYCFIAYIAEGYSVVNAVGNNLCAFLPLCLFAYLAERGVMTEKFVSRMTVILLLACVAYYIHYEQVKMMARDLDADASTTINASTVFLMMIPLLFYERKRFLLYIELAVCVFFIVSAVKRGNIVAAVLPVAILLWYQYKGSKRNALGLLFLLLVVVAGSYYLQRYMFTSYYFQKRMEATLEGVSSGRDRIYMEAYYIWYGSNSFHRVLGNGYRAVTRTIGTPAHSDWIEILVDNGIMGVVIYLGLFVSFFRRFSITRTLPEKYVLLSALLVWFAKSVYSMAYVEGHLNLLMISIGVAMCRPKQEMEVLNASD